MNGHNGIAIVGLAGRFPGAENTAELWKNLVEGCESITFFSDAELAAAGLDITHIRREGAYVPARGVLKDADCFDALFFGIHPKEAEIIDPQHRVFLETCWSALEDAGYAPNEVEELVGVFGGSTYNTYWEKVLLPRPDLREMIGDELLMFGNEPDYLATRVAYKLGLRGPALSIATACSTSLVAVVQAVQSLLTFQCDIALAGGVSVKIPQQSGYHFQEGHIGSPDGHTRTFDAEGAGTVFSNGVGVVVLRRLEDAIQAGDRILAVIRGAAINNDGMQRVSFGAPGVEGQADVISTAQALAGIDASTITYVEAHGTATPLGDPIEVAALTRAFRASTDEKQYCALGSIKTNVGHLEAAAGVAGLIKTILSLVHQVRPGTLHFRSPNPKLDIENSPFYITAESQPWDSREDTPRRAGVSSFGSGGTNAHVIVEEAPLREPTGGSRSWQLLTLSAKTLEALDRATTQLARFLDGIESGDEGIRQFADVAFTLKTGRSAFLHRRIVVARNARDAAAALHEMDPKRVHSELQKLQDAPVVFLFPGQGAQFAGMAAEVYKSEAVFRQTVDQCAEILHPFLGLDIRSVLFPDDPSLPEHGQRLMETRFTQPALFVVEYALAQLWISWGVRPAAMMGHSVGEYVAACVAGVMSLETALHLITQRAAMVNSLPGGAMLAVRLPAREVATLLDPHLAIAAVNGESLCVVAGPHDAIAELDVRLKDRSVVTRLLRTSHAFHSAMMDPVLEPFEKLVRQMPLSDPLIPFVSNVTARWITPEEAKSPQYWAGHLRQTVRFADGVAELLKDPRHILLEVGPGQTLSQLVRAHSARAASQQPVFATLPLSGEAELCGLKQTLGDLWMAGAKLDWKLYYQDERRRKTACPTYPFERKRYWPEASRQRADAQLAEPLSTVQDSFATPVSFPSVVPDAFAMTTPPSRRDYLLTLLRGALQDLSGYDFATADAATDLLELGLDSLLLTQAAQLLQKRFGVSVSFRQLMENLSSMGAIATYLDGKLTPELFLPPPLDGAPKAAIPFGTPTLNAAVSASQVPSNAPMGISETTPETHALLAQIVLQQQQLTSQIVQFLMYPNAPVALRPPATEITPVVPPPPTPAPAPHERLFVTVAEGKSHGPFKKLDRGANLKITAEQEQFLNALMVRYNRRHAKSKEMVAANRELLADPRSAAGFKQLWKEMVYPIVTTRSEGSRVWDVDGNEYIDFMMGFGASMFGHRPKFVVDAVHRQLDTGFEIGPIQPLSYEVAALVREFTGMERVAFTNTGSEAVLAAIRLARTVTGRDKIAVFAGSYHGIFDEVLFRPLVANGEMRTAPIAPGIAQSAISEVVVLDYGNPESIEVLKARGSEIAAVLVEPVQSRRLDLQPKQFLHDLRAVATDIGAALIFDEVVTGFRVHPGGSQAYFEVRADLATYGKVIGGGISVGVVAGDAKYMDALDGGSWQYGDSSFPEVGVTFFAGTFVRHPLALAAAKAVLLHLKREGPQLQERLAARTRRLAQNFHELIIQYGAPYVVTQFSSLIQIGFPVEEKLGGLLFYLLRDNGIHIFENRAFVLTTAHTEEDLVKLVDTFKLVLSEMQEAGFFCPGFSGVTPHSEPLTHESSVETASSFEQAPSADLKAPFSLTEAQREVWLASQMGGEAAIGYNESLQLQFRGPFDVSLFRAAVQKVLERHPILTACIAEDGQSQRVTGQAIELPFDDLTPLEPSDKEAKLRAFVDAAVSTPFDLTVGPLVRARILRLTSDYHVVIWTTHHIVCDGWSAGVLIDEMASIYSTLRRGAAPALDTPYSFHDYALDAQPESEAALAALEYWREQFATVPSPLELPTDYPRPAVRSGRAATAYGLIEKSTYLALKQIAAKERTTLVVLLMAGLKCLLSRLTGQTDLLVGLGAAGQAVTGRTCLVGHCLNLLPVRTELDPDATFRESIAAVRAKVLDAFDHHQCTVGGILQHLKVRRSASRPPLVEVIFNLDRDPAGAVFEGLVFQVARNPKRALHYDFFFNFTEGADGLRLECDYNTDLFAQATVERWLGHYRTLLLGVAEDPGVSLAALPMLAGDERQRLLEEWNDTTVVFEQGADCLHELFEQQVQRTPQAIAASFGEEQCSYAKLNRDADQLAARLRAMDLEPNALVGVYLDRSLDMVVTVLGILKAGLAYLPLDTGFPVTRLAYMIEDSRISALVTHKGLAARLPAVPSRVIDLNEPPPREPDLPVGRIRLAKSDDLAYVLYTSGSTGKPKGVTIPHSAIVNFLLSMRRAPGMNNSDTLLAVTTLSFDIAGLELFLPLISGSRVVIASREDVADPTRLMGLMQSSKCTVMQATPATWISLVDAGWQGKKDLKVLCGGEAMPRQLAQDLLSRCGELWNMYGPTETTVWSTIHRVMDLEGEIPIGQPIANTQVYVLDTHRTPVPPGVLGELYIGGSGLAQGYLHRPELTDERFVPAPAVRADRVYRTGDLARWKSDGTLECLGRVDNQVKLRGFRIELGEIEAHLAAHPSVGRCVVVIRDLPGGERALVAYFETKFGNVPAASDLRTHLKRDLPGYMIPTLFVAIEQLKLTPNGKVDRKALPNPAADLERDHASFVEPKDSIEEMLVRVWSMILGVRRIGTRDDFFDLGGHSLLAVRVIRKVEALYGVRLPLATLLQAPTIVEFAEVLRNREAQPGWSSLVPIQPSGQRQPFYLFHSHGGNVLEYQPLVSLLDRDQPILGLQARGLDGHIARNQTIQGIAANYIEEMKALHPHGPYYLGGFCFGGLVALEVARQLRAAGAQVALVVLMQTSRPGLVPVSGPGPGSAIERTINRVGLELEHIQTRGLSYGLERLRRFRDVRQARRVLAQSQALEEEELDYEGFPLSVILEALGAEHDKAYDRYIPTPYGGRVVLFRSEKQIPLLQNERALGWESLLSDLTVIDIPGYQQTMLVEPNVQWVVRKLQPLLDYPSGQGQQPPVVSPLAMRV